MFRSIKTNCGRIKEMLWDIYGNYVEILWSSMKNAKKNFLRNRHKTVLNYPAL